AAPIGVPRDPVEIGDFIRKPPWGPSLHGYHINLPDVVAHAVYIRKRLAVRRERRRHVTHVRLAVRIRMPTRNLLKSGTVRHHRMECERLVRRRSDGDGKHGVVLVRRPGEPADLSRTERHHLALTPPE